VDGMVEMRGKHIELKHFLISRLSSKTEAELETHRVENLRREGVALTVESAAKLPRYRCPLHEI